MKLQMPQKEALIRCIRFFMLIRWIIVPNIPSNPAPTLTLPLKGRGLYDVSSPFKGEVRRGMGLGTAAICALFLACLAAPAAAADADGKLSLKLDRARLYLGESAIATVTLHIGASAAMRNMRYPVLTAPAVSVGEFAPPAQDESLPDGVATTAYIFTARVTPQKTGVHRLGPARLTGEVSRPAEGAGGFFGETSQQEVELLFGSA